MLLKLMKISMKEIILAPWIRFYKDLYFNFFILVHLFPQKYCGEFEKMIFSPRYSIWFFIFFTFLLNNIGIEKNPHEAGPFFLGRLICRNKRQ